MALPDPLVAPAASSADYLAAARTAIYRHRFGEATEALERAETRILDRSVQVFQTRTADDRAGVSAINTALMRLADGDAAGSLAAIGAAELAGGS